MLDYDLDEYLTGPEVARMLGDIPILVVSRNASSLTDTKGWGANIKGFFQKKNGVPQLLDLVLEIASNHAQASPKAVIGP